jgi:hypothetical protein
LRGAAVNHWLEPTGPSNVWLSWLLVPIFRICGLDMAEEEKRLAPRQRVLKAAKIITMDNTSVVDCTVRNMSETGAQLVIEKSVKMPDEFQFFLANGDTVRDAELAWHRGDRVGVKFKGEVRPAPPAVRMYKR